MYATKLEAGLAALPLRFVRASLYATCVCLCYASSVTRLLFQFVAIALYLIPGGMFGLPALYGQRACSAVIRGPHANISTSKCRSWLGPWVKQDRAREAQHTLQLLVLVGPYAPLSADGG